MPFDRPSDSVPLFETEDMEQDYVEDSQDVLETHVESQEDSQAIDSDATPDIDVTALATRNKKSSSTSLGVTRLPKKVTSTQTRTKTAFSVEQEIELGCWFEEHPILYNKNEREYKDSDKKNALYETMGESLTPPVSGNYHTFVMIL